MARTILHADLDAFYASVEQMDRPELRGKPVVVGGPPESRGVVAAASYEARRFGVRSAMPMATALRLCPQAVRVPPRFDRYRELSARVLAIYRAVTPLVEPLALDEAYLDATAVAERYGGGEALARYLKAAVRRETGLSLSVGAGANKAVAKIASDLRKPDGLVVVPSGQEAAFLAPLPVRELWGIGPRAEQALARVGIRTIGELAAADATTVRRVLGSRGPVLQRMAQGDDPRPVQPDRPHKSVGAETTFAHDLPDGPELRAALVEQASLAAQRLHEHGLVARTVVLKLRYRDFRSVTRQVTLPHATADTATIADTAERLLNEHVHPGDQFRLVGVTCTGLAHEAQRPLPL